jgi:hypothetical protein
MRHPNGPSISKCEPGLPCPDFMILLPCESTRGAHVEQAATHTPDPGLGSIGALRDDADLLDQAVEHAMRVREERPWRLGIVE